MTADVAICICTYRRPQSLARLLESVEQLDLGELSVAVHVADNDPSGSAGEVIEAFRKRLPLDDCIEPKPGYAHARNAVLAMSKAPLIAMVDDDQVVPPDWLLGMTGALERYGADIVIGRVRSAFTGDAPAWAARHPFFNLPAPATGTRLTSGYSGNALLRRAAFGKQMLRFDEAFTLTGGEDADFFHRAHLGGLRIVFCREACATEFVGPERTRLDWVRSRAFRTGRAYSDIYIRPRARLRRLSWFARKLAQALVAAALLPLGRMVGERWRVSIETQLHSSLGQLASALDLGDRGPEVRADRQTSPAPRPTMDA